MDVSRRDLFKGGTAIAAGLAATGAVAAFGCAQKADGDTEEQDKKAITWDAEADIIVVGAGCTGLYAAAGAGDEGATVMVLEKEARESAGGATRCFGASLLYRNADTLEAQTLYRLPRKACEKLADMQPEIKDWFDEHTDIEWLDNRSWPVAKGGGVALAEAMLGYAEKSGLDIKFETPAKKLITNDEGRVIGVVAGKDGNEKNYKAKKGVVLTTGGYESNPKLASAFVNYCIETVTVSHPACTGDGMLMALGAGGALDALASGMEWFEFAFAKASKAVGTAITNRQFNLKTATNADNIEAVPSKIWVDLDGKRFMNENTMTTHDKGFSLPWLAWDGRKADFSHLPLFIVLDNDCFEGQPLGKVPGDEDWTYNNAVHAYEWSDDNKTELEKGWLVSANTIEELAAKMTAVDYITGETRTVDAEGLKATIDEWNAACAAGYDPLGRADYTMRPIINPPFYAAELMPCTLYTVGGVKTDGDSRVLDWSDNPVPGLYAAGNIGQGSMRAVGATTCMVRGRVAVMNAAASEAWDAEA